MIRIMFARWGLIDTALWNMFAGTDLHTTALAQHLITANKGFTLSRSCPDGRKGTYARVCSWREVLMHGERLEAIYFLHESIHPAIRRSVQATQSNEGGTTV